VTASRTTIHAPHGYSMPVVRETPRPSMAVSGVTAW
jgi:hypothetical protein